MILDFLRRRLLGLDRIQRRTWSPVLLCAVGLGGVLSDLAGADSSPGDSAPAQPAAATPDIAARDAKPEPRLEPLFDIGLAQPFPSAAQAFDEARQLILSGYYTEKLTEEALYFAAIEGMLRHISPPGAPELGKLWTPEQYDKVREGLEGTDATLGLKCSFNPNDGSLTVNEVRVGAPAEGIVLPGDRILRIDAQPLKGRTVADIDRLLNGPEESAVTLTINRDIKIIDIKLTRHRYHTREWAVHPLGGGLFLVEVSSFPIGLAAELEGALREAQEQGATGFILDLRNNGGGVFGEALQVAKLFIAEKGIVLRTYDQDHKLRNYVSGSPEPVMLRLAVLANGSTASAAEIVAGALRDQRKAPLIGSKTFGKGVFEKTFTLAANQYRMKFITGAMFTPAGQTWQGKGLAPDFYVESEAATVTALRKLDLTTRLSRDVALITAIKLLKMANPAEAQPVATKPAP